MLNTFEAALRRAASNILEYLLAPPMLRRYKVLGFRITVPPRVFDPILSLSGYLLARTCATLNPQRRGEPAAEPFCGAGLASLTLARQGFYVVASDAILGAVYAAKRNAAENKLDALVDVVQADKLSHLRRGAIEVVVMNPPYLPGPRRNSGDPLRAGLRLQVLTEALRQALRSAKRYVIVTCDYTLPGKLIARLGPVKAWLLGPQRRQD